MADRFLVADRFLAADRLMAAGRLVVSNKRFMRKAHIRAFFVWLLLAVSMASIGVASPVYADEWGASKVLTGGRSGSCTWKYVQTGDETILIIAPLDGEEGTLGPYDDPATGFSPYPWNYCRNYKEATKHVLVRGKVKVQSNAEKMFRGFIRAVSFDLRGLDVSSVKVMVSMFSWCQAVTWLDLSTWDVSQVKSMRLMFNQCPALTDIDLSSWEVSSVVNLSYMFSQCPALTSLDVSNWNVSHVRTLEGMFAGCSALTTLDLSRWRASGEIAMDHMFGDTQSLEMIMLGPHFLIDDSAAFDDAGSSVGTNWMQVNLAESIMEAKPQRRVFGSSSELLAFHRDRTLRKTDTEAYIRVVPVELTIGFNKGAEDATGEMAPHVYSPGVAAPLAKNAYARDGYVFDGWKDPDGNVYTDEHFFRNDYFKRVPKNEKVAHVTLELVALWKKL